MVRRSKSVTASGEAALTREAASVQLGSVVHARSGGYGPYRDAADQSVEMAIRHQAEMLRKAIEVARAEGYVVQMPFRVEDLSRIAVSATAKTAPAT